MADYYVIMDEVDALGTAYDNYQASLIEAFQNLQSSIDDLAALGSFQGDAAVSIKAYFQEVHSMLIGMLWMLAQQLLTDFEKEYGSGFSEQPVSEMRTAKLPEDGMKDAERAFADMLATELADAESYLREAMNLMPSGVSFSMPSSDGIRSYANEQIDKTAKVREGVRALEDAGYALFANKESDFQELASKVEDAIAACASGAVSLSGYESGAIYSVVDMSGLQVAYENCAADQEENREVVLKACDERIQREQLRIEDAQREAAEKKAFWNVIGTIASVAVVVAGAAAIVATAGTASPLVLAASGVGLMSSGKDLGERVGQLYSMSKGDIGADRPGYTFKEEAGSLKDLAKAGDKFNDIAEHQGKGNYAEVRRDAAGFTGFLGGKVIDKGIDYVAESTGDEEMEAWINAGGEFVSEGYENYVDSAFKATAGGVSKGVATGSFTSDAIATGAGWVGACGKAVTVVTDHYSEKYDEQIDELERESESLDELQTKRASQSAPAWAW